MWEKLGSGRKKLQDHPGLRVLVAVGLGMAIAVVTTLATPVAKMSNLINDLTTKVTKTEQASKIAKPPIIRPGPARSIRISYPPCLDSDLDCYVQFTAEDEVMVKLFTAATLTLIFTLPIFFALGHSMGASVLIRAAYRGRRIEMGWRFAADFPDQLRRLDVLVTGGCPDLVRM